MSIYIEGIGIAEYRSFGPEIQRIGPFSKINIFVGQNNSGKSNILRFLVDHYHSLAVVARSGGISSTVVDLTYYDRHLQSTRDRSRYAIGARSTRARLEASLQSYHHHLAPQHVDWLEGILSSPIMTHYSRVTWFDYTWPVGPRTELYPEIVENLHSANVLKPDEWQEVWAILMSARNGDIVRDCIPGTLQILCRIILNPPAVTMVPAIRQVGGSPTNDKDFNGAKLIDQLARLKDPDEDRQEDRVKSKALFDEINRFVQNVVGSKDATLEIPYSRDRILVHMDGKTLPLSSLGTGIHEVIILAAAATVLRNQVLCLEEPEIHLHPTLQRKLLRYLSERTDNQYFIATHSAHLLNSEGVAVFHVRLENGQSIVRQAIDPMERANVCADLGYHASDLLQANCIIWVEGPSDRVYLNHWIHDVDLDLVEGLHYSIMFYGGRLLSHLTSEQPPEVNEFISLRRLNQNIVIVIDSDKRSSHAHISDTKRRIAAEFDKGPGFAWITQGREIENYVPAQTIETVIKELYPYATGISCRGTYDDCLEFRTGRNAEVRQADKMRVARAVVGQAPELDVLDLRSQMNRLAEFIRKSNPDT